MKNQRKVVAALKEKVAQLKQDCRNYLHEVEALKSKLRAADGDAEETTHG